MLQNEGRVQLKIKKKKYAEETTSLVDSCQSKMNNDYTDADKNGQYDCRLMLQRSAFYVNTFLNVSGLGRNKRHAE